MGPLMSSSGVASARRPRVARSPSSGSPAHMPATPTYERPRSSGGNFGVVTSFELRLHELGPQVFALNVAYPVEEARVGAEDTAFGDRSSEWMLSIDSTWHEPSDDAVNVAYTRALFDAMLPYFDGKTYFNFPGLLEEGDAAVRASYGANHDRLARIKAAYDPENRFRLNQNIRPAA